MTKGSWNEMRENKFNFRLRPEDVLKQLKENGFDVEEYLRSCAVRGANWITDIAQIRDKDSDLYGAMKTEYHTDSQRWSFFEPIWHTGQAILALVQTYRLTRDKKYLKHAKIGADYIHRFQFHDRNDPRTFGLIRGYIDPRAVITNTTTMLDGFEGLLELYRETEDEKYLLIVQDAVDWILRNAYLPKERLIMDIFNFEKKEFIRDERQLSKLSQRKFARPNLEGPTFLQLYQLTKDKRYRTLSKELCDRVVEDQDEDGQLYKYHPSDEKTKTAHIRLGLWYALPMLLAYDEFKDERYKTSALKFADWYVEHQFSDGGFPYKIRADRLHKSYTLCGSGVAMAVRFWLEIYNRFGGEKYLIAARKGLDFLIYTQFSDEFPDKNLRGAFYESWGFMPFGGSAWFCLRDIATSFGVQAVLYGLKNLKKLI